MYNLFRAALTIILVGLSGAVAASTENRQEPAAPESVAAEPKVLPPAVQMVRTLQLMQDQIAIGSTEAHMGQRGLLTILDTRFMELDQNAWMDRRNVRAAAAFVLSGGSPPILRKILEMGNPSLPPEERPFVEGVLAYVEGREEEAKGKLLSVDIESLPPMLSAQMALVQSALLVRSDAKKSNDLLDYVRLQAPGTLLEEGALRRQVFVSSQTGDMKKFLALSSGYLRRYRHSIYAGNFRQRLASVLTRIDFGKDQALFNAVVDVLADLEPDARRDLYLLTARSSIDQGFTKSALLLADKAADLSGTDIASAARAKLYRAAAMVVSPETIQTAVENLQSIDRAVLSETDSALLNSALAMAGQIRLMPGAKIAESNGKISDGSAKAEPSPQQGGQQAPEQLQAVLKARDALSRIDKLIKNPVSTVQ
ncbi:chemotaxis protein MotC [Microvirga solisilvae]|uniref:chemotaxis protein MotC n=1 Tax=Microvirga solisilvae TaxID=2919498 RepID=UPI001FAEFA43|nr:chemotaxis protein MotC [Microvirga solisilvae]